MKPLLAALLLALTFPACAYDLDNLPPLEVGAGLFYTPGKYANETLYLAAMRDAGCNTFAPQARPLAGQPAGETAGQAIAREVNAAAQVGLLDVRFPVICYSVNPPDLIEAKLHKLPDVDWPELVVQSIDEPNQTQETTLRQYRDAAHAAGMRIGTALAGYGATGYAQQLPWCTPENAGKWVPQIGQYLDLWICLVGTFGEGTFAAARKQGAQVGGYLAYPSSNVLDRWTLGLWAWKAKTFVNLLWAAINPQEGWDYSRIREVSGTEFDAGGLDGIREGILDYRVLQAVRDLHTPAADKWLASVEEQVPLGWWPSGYVATDQDKQVPSVDMGAIRAAGLALLDGG